MSLQSLLTRATVLSSEPGLDMAVQFLTRDLNMWCLTAGTGSLSAISNR